MDSSFICLDTYIQHIWFAGLDPAGPFFNNKPHNMVIAKDDADFVDIIHTNDGTFGTTRRDGDIDIWVNGGAFQPGCTFSDILRRGRVSLNDFGKYQ